MRLIRAYIIQLNKSSRSNGYRASPVLLTNQAPFVNMYYGGHNSLHKIVWSRTELLRLEQILSNDMYRPRNGSSCQFNYSAVVVLGYNW